MQQELTSHPKPSMPDAPFENKDVVEALYRYYADGAFSQMHQLFHPDAVWIQMDGFPGGGAYTGSETIIQQVFGRLKDEWNDWKASVETFVEAQDAVFVLGHYTGTYVLTGKAFTADFIHHYQLKRRKIIRFKQYTDTAQIMKATIE